MNNADMPAMPYTVKPSKERLEQSAGNGVIINDKNYLGLTKREHFAGLAMQGLCHAADSEGTWAHDADTVAIAATNYADALLAELDKVQQ
jgi:hypothetical protein